MNIPPLIEVLRKEIDYKAISKYQADVLGDGTYGITYRGRWKETDIAIKSFSMKSLPDYLKREFDPYCIANYEHIVRFFGVCTRPGKFSVITELMRWSLKSYFHSHPGPLSYGIKERIRKDVTKGLSYLHDMDIPHKRIKDSNVFLTSDYHAKLGNFALADLRRELGDHSPNHPSVRWKAPETLTGEYRRIKNTTNASKYADIYSLAVVFWQLESGTIPFPDESEPSVLQALCIGTRPCIDPKWEKDIQRILNDCWHYIPLQRPTAAQLLTKIKQREIKQVYLTFMHSRDSNSVFSQPGMRDILPIIAQFLFKL